MSSEPTEQQQPPPPQSQPEEETSIKTNEGENNKAEDVKLPAPVEAPSASHDEHRNRSHSPSRSRSRNRSRSRSRSRTRSRSRSRSTAGGRNSSAKNDICRDFLRGACSRGASCRFRHEADGESSTSLGNDAERVYCKDFLNNKCTRQHCRYIHCTRADEAFFLAHHRFPPGTHAESELYYRFDEFRPLLGPHAVRPPPPSNQPFPNEMEPMFNEGPMLPPGPMLQLDSFEFPTALEPCKDFLQHKCLRGSRCRFRHVAQEQADKERRYLELKRELVALDAEGVGRVFEEFARSQRFGPMGPPGGPMGGPMGGPPPGPMHRPPMGMPPRGVPGPMGGPRGPGPMQQQAWGGGQQRGPPPNYRQQQQQMPQQGMQMAPQQMQMQRPMRQHGYDSNAGQPQQQWNDGWGAQQQQQQPQQGPLYGETQANYSQAQVYDPLAAQQQLQQQQYIEQKLTANTHLQQQQQQPQQPQQQQLVQYPIGAMYRPRG
jgi:hypothetical protein